MRRKESTYYQTYHVYNYGVDKTTIFRDKKDIQSFCELVNYYAEKYYIDIFAFCLIRHRYDMLIRPKRGSFKDISDFMQYAIGRYTMNFNKRSLKYFGKKRHGRIFGCKYYSIPINNEDELIKAVVEIHKKSKLDIEQLSDYEWSSFRKYLHRDNIDSCIHISTMYFENIAPDELIAMHKELKAETEAIIIHEGEYYLSYGLLKK
ncbi:MAG TPA: hypothetical protein GXZ66_03985 [Clostridiaceae bacterium]|nr:hypothetical protein [Clostridiaceae bacterium]HOA32508.1 hypothetical protein [Clostridia bacterium]